jgi:hypothetical protein
MKRAGSYVDAYRTAATLLLSVCLAGCADENSRYQHAIYESAVWTGGSGKPLRPLTYPVSAVTLTAHAAWAEDHIGEPTTLGRDIWITIEPDVQTICKNTPSKDVISRLHEVLGMKPENTDDSNDMFVVLSIEDRQGTGPANIGVFRPCADPNPTSSSCTNEVNGPLPYDQWLLRQMVTSYTVSGNLDSTGYPFTRLGYTYDWGAGAQSDHLGVQEYVVPKGTLVTIHNVVSAIKYCSARGTP